ncbi:hypothetical protein J3R30DRAFT_85630 [Lentinula aciculospora]|uniref:Uncharacterized protein n=1 Tax=Lentinula aciculospora TaxID=153920 RepID=A0A9W9DYV2_9AGAR|nr:hypothetical protein J3R30DRAFT_85630 [Lentinula aciculospora]
MLRSKSPCQLVLIRHVSTITNKETTKIFHRRIEKAERDERMDLTTALTPARTYMGGFTRPTDLRASNWFPGGAYVSEGRRYEEPSPFAYEPHTVFLLESRYDIKYQIGRTDSPAHIVAVCRASDLEAVLEMFNSKGTPRDCKQLMDNARWPWLSPKKVKPVKWWTSDEERMEALQSLGYDTATSVGHQAVQNALEQASRDNDDEELKAKKDFRRHLAQTAAVAARVSEEQQLSNIATDIKPLQGKIPFELEFEDGTVAHPSGFVPPTPADRQYDPEYHLSPHPHSRVATELRRRQMETVNEHHSDSLVPRIEQWKALKERKDEEGGLMSTLTTGILSGGVSAATEPRDAKIPTEIHGVHDNAVAQPMQHPSGFVPPTARMSRGESDARTSIVKGQNSNSGEAPEAPERWPTFASSDIDHVDETDSAVATSSNPGTHQQAVSDLRQKYFEFIKDEPFWRPLIALTVSTRPIAKTLARLSRGLSQGKPFYSIVSPDDRKARASFAGRLRSLRVTRMRTLAIEMAQLLAGARGGPIGVRFDEHSRGRGIDGEGLDKPIPWDKRVIGVGIGQWYPLADELIESFKVLAEKEVTEVYESDARKDTTSKSPFLIYEVDDHGRPIGEVPEFPWPVFDKMNDDVRTGIQALGMVMKMERLLLYDSPAGRVLSAIVDSPSSRYTDLIEAIGDHHTPVTFRFVNDSQPLAEAAELRAGYARTALKKRIDNFYREHTLSIALAKAMRVSGVIYPHSEKDWTKKLVNAREKYQFSAEDEHLNLYAGEDAKIDSELESTVSRG